MLCGSGKGLSVWDQCHPQVPFTEMHLFVVELIYIHVCPFWDTSLALNKTDRFFFSSAAVSAMQLLAQTLPLWYCLYIVLMVVRQYQQR